MELQNTRAAVLVEQMYQEMEVWYPVYRLREAGCRVTLIGPEAGQTYPSKLGYPVKSDKAAKEVVAAICHGPWMLCSTQALKGRKATCFFAIKDDVINAGGKYVDQEVVRDGNIITSRKPDDLPAFMQTIIQALKEAKP